MKLTFLGATGTVTGSKTPVSAGGRNMLVDCGLFQGLKQLRLKNREPLPVDSGSIDAVVLTHAHIDHSGYLPLLVRNGFAGKVYCSAGALLGSASAKVLQLAPVPVTLVNAPAGPDFTGRLGAT